jgi:glycosyltransferase involved in cell wall biosynthesis
MGEGMKIVHVSTDDFYGGAARAAYRLVRGLRQIGHDCRMVVKKKKSHDGFVIPVGPESDSAVPTEEILYQYFYHFYLLPRRTELSNTPYSFPGPGYDLSGLKPIKEADVIHLHWICDFQSLPTIKALLALGKPVVWTLHDQWAFTGGCHYTSGCENYLAKCNHCPQLLDDEYGGCLASFQDKQHLFERYPVTIVTPSKWMADCCRKSRILGKNRIEVIPNSLETDVFSPLSKEAAKKSLGIGANVSTVLFCAEYGGEKRKGFHKLIEAINHCKSDPGFLRAVEENRIRLICIGHPGSLTETLDLQVTSLGYVESEQELRRAYSAADLFILPSLEDNLPNTILEALSCATPVIAFDAGGIGEAIEEGVTGFLVARGDSQQMAQTIAAAIGDPQKLQRMSHECRRSAVEKFALGLQARSMLDLYREQLNGEPKSSSPEPDSAAERSVTGHHAPIRPDVGGRFKKCYSEMRLVALEKAVLFLHKDQAAKEKEIEALKSVTEDREQLVDKFANLAKAFQEQYGSQMETLQTLADDRLTRINQLEQELERLREIAVIRNLKAFLRPRLGTLYQYPPRQMHIPERYRQSPGDRKYQKVSIVTPSYNQEKFIERTIRSVLDQNYPALEYFVQDGRSQDGTVDLLKKFDDSGLKWEAAVDDGQADAINKGFAKTTGSIMAYLNSDDMLFPGALIYVSDYFNRHPEIDVVYGHRVIINEDDMEIGRWVMPPHDKEALLWADFIPQETLFWRREIWEKAGGFVDKSFRFALDWDLLLRFQAAGANFKRLPRFLGAFRVHADQKTSSEMEATGSLEMDRLRQRHLGREVTHTEVRRNIRPYLLKHVLLNKLYRIRFLRY